MTFAIVLAKVIGLFVALCIEIPPIHALCWILNSVSNYPVIIYTASICDRMFTIEFSVLKSEYHFP
uniref:Uncharacterized protein n=1 Tax=Eubacterium cellulosolvens (strain ATCC 43171 / JCM 9499 / 6) TaxID=633697 RepID=I5AXC6_EUBC6